MNEVTKAMFYKRAQHADPLGQTTISIDGSHYEFVEVVGEDPTPPEGYVSRDEISGGNPEPPKPKQDPSKAVKADLQAKLQSFLGSEDAQSADEVADDILLERSPLAKSKDAALAKLAKAYGLTNVADESKEAYLRRIYAAALAE